jgi:hypothetical protein
VIEVLGAGQGKQAEQAGSIEGSIFRRCWGGRQRGEGEGERGEEREEVRKGRRWRWRG